MYLDVFLEFSFTTNTAIINQAKYLMKMQYTFPLSIHEKNKNKHIQDLDFESWIIVAIKEIDIHSKFATHPHQ